MGDLKNQLIKGNPFSPGYAIAVAYVRGLPSLKFRRKKITRKDIAKELDRFEKAVNKTRLEIEAMRVELKSKIGEKDASILDLQLFILEDPFLFEKMKRSLHNDLLNVEFIFYQILKQYHQQLTFSDDFYIRERWSDIEDVGRRILKNLFDKNNKFPEKNLQKDSFPENRVMIVKNLLVSDFAKMHLDGVTALLISEGSQTSHVAILARSFKIPAIFTDEKSLAPIQTGDTLIIDAVVGEIWLHPDKDTLKKYQKKKEKYFKDIGKLKDLKNIPSKTKDKNKITLLANIERPEDLESALDNGAEGIGLFRTEFLYMNRDDLPDEEEHYEVYRWMLQQLHGYPLVVRTLDVGGDKFSPQLNIEDEQNPALGCRGIRYCLENVDIFKVQIRALLRASLHGSLKIMFPMISGREEFILLQAIIEEVKSELTQQKKKFLSKLTIGVMIETPSSAITADLLTDLVQFFSIGTNDLTQYTLAVDRSNHNAQAYFYRMHPSLLRLINGILKVAKKSKIDVSLCGELSSDTMAIEILLGLGLRTLSISHTLIPDVKRVVRLISIESAKIFAKKLLSCKSADEIERLAQDRFQQLMNTKL